MCSASLVHLCKPAHSAWSLPVLPLSCLKADLILSSIGFCRKSKINQNWPHLDFFMRNPWRNKPAEILQWALQQQREFSRHTARKLRDVPDPASPAITLESFSLPAPFVVSPHPMEASSVLRSPTDFALQLDVLNFHPRVSTLRESHFSN